MKKSEFRYENLTGCMFFFDDLAFYDIACIDKEDENEFSDGENWGAWFFNVPEKEIETMEKHVGIENLASYILENGMYLDRGISTNGFKSLTDLLDDFYNETRDIEPREIIRAHFLGKYKAMQLPPDQRFDDFDIGGFNGWYLVGNPAIMEHNKRSYEWDLVEEWSFAESWTDCLIMVSDYISQGVPCFKTQEFLHDIITALAADWSPKPYAEIKNQFNRRFIADVFGYFSHLVPFSDFACSILSLLNDEGYSYMQIFGAVQSDWQNMYYPTAEEDQVEHVRESYFNLYEQFKISGDDIDTMIVTAYGDTEKDWKEHIACQIGCDVEDIDMYMITGQHTEYDYERR